MSTLAPQREEAVAFHYGFLSSRTSGILKEYLDSHQIQPGSESILQEADRLLDDLLSAQALWEPHRNTAAASPEAVQALNCALDVMVAHHAEFQVSTWAELAGLFETIHDTLSQLLENRPPAEGDVHKTRMFFSRLAELMLAQITSQNETAIIGGM
jgi:hypothetical protein